MLNLRVRRIVTQSYS